MQIPAVKLNQPEVIEVYTKTAFIYDIWGAINGQPVWLSIRNYHRHTLRMPAVP